MFQSMKKPKYRFCGYFNWARTLKFLCR